MSRLTEALARRGYLMSDGAMGTELFAHGLQSGEAPELWNVERASDVRAVYCGYIESGSDIIITNSFGGNSYRLRLHAAADRVFELNSRAAILAREAIDESGREVLLGGSMGPSGEILQPVGSLSLADAEAAFYAQASALLAGGVDILWIETMSSLEEVGAAMAGAQRAITESRSDADIAATLTFDTNGCTMMGVTPSQAVEFFTSHSVKVAAFGLNCGLGPAETVASLLRMRQANTDTVLICQANCGIPEYKHGEFHFNATPELMAQYALLAYACGARIIGGCCGSGVTVMKAIRAALDNDSRIANRDPIALPSVDDIIAVLGDIRETSYAMHAPPAQATQKKSRMRRRS